MHFLLFTDEYARMGGVDASTPFALETIHVHSRRKLSPSTHGTYTSVAVNEAYALTAGNT